MFAMSLPSGQQRMLDTIEGKLAESDPRLVSLFAIFSRLTRTENMPWIEQLRARPVADRMARIGGSFRWLARPPVARMRGMLLLPAALTAMACALTIAFGFPGSQRPVPGAKMPAARELVVRSRELAGKSRELAGRSRLCRSISLVRTPAFAC
jgi:hypothetical protein